MRKQIRNNERELIIKAWASSIKDYPKLSIEEAKDICRKINITTGKEKELLREKLITGTLYVVLDFVTNSILPIFEFKTFDMNDIISTFNEVWIEMLDDNKILLAKTYKDFFNRTTEFYTLLNSKLSIISEEYFTRTNFNCNIENFIDILNWYIQTRVNRDGQEVSFEEFDNYFSMNVTTKKKGQNRRTHEMCKTIYEMINFDDENRKKFINYRQLYLFRYMFLENGMYKKNPNISEVTVGDTTFETVAYKMIVNQLIDYIFNEPYLTDREKNVLRQLYGLAGENPRNYTEIAKNLGVSRQRTRQNFEEAVGKLMENPDFRQLIEEFQTKDACNRKHC